jgi:hypothetical protein
VYFFIGFIRRVAEKERRKKQVAMKEQTTD